MTPTNLTLTLEKWLAEAGAAARVDSYSLDVEYSARRGHTFQLVVRTAQFPAPSAVEKIGPYQVTAMHVAHQGGPFLVEYRLDFQEVYRGLLGPSGSVAQMFNDFERILAEAGK